MAVAINKSHGMVNYFSRLQPNVTTRIMKYRGQIMRSPFTITKIALGILIATTASNLFAAELNTSSKISNVTVFPGSAKVSRIATLQVPDGESTLSITDLPMNLVATSLRVSGESDSNIGLGSVSLTRNVTQNVVLEKEQALRKQIEALNEERSELSDTVSRANAKLSYIKAMGAGSNGETGTSYLQLPMDQWQQAWQMLGTATEEAQTTIRQTNAAIKQLDSELQKLQTELRDVASNQKSTRVATLNLNAESAGEITIKLDYMINGAGWAPVYDADINTENGQLSIKTQAEIYQRTGENWVDTNVTLSTLRPSQSSQLIELQPWSIDFRNDQLMMSRGAAVTEMAFSADAMEEASVMSKSVASAPRRKVQVQQSNLVSADFSAEYVVPSTVTLDTGNEKRRFLLNTQDFESDIVLASTPRLDPRVLLTTSFTYDKETPLLAGVTSLYRDGNYVGSSRISQKQAGEKVRLSFAEDDKVKLSFQPAPDTKRNDGVFFGKSKVVERGYQIKINNLHSKAYPIHIFDNIPVASHDDIEVKLSGAAPTAQDIDDKKGVMRWERTLKPNSEERLEYGYRVTYPEDKTLQGL
ncbi:mucoidy inhibitor MuiA family protein [Leucothrix sargassi]|nr:mucoidy inhibitor MuiA family protein [Leucothrix sargassi]